MKMKLLLIIISLSLLTSCGSESGYRIQPDWGINPDMLPAKVTESDLPNFQNFDLQSLYGFQSKNVLQKDFSGLSDSILSFISFDTYTKWPSKSNLPEGYNPKKWLETGKDPGLNINKLHREGYTGKGISVAIIDKPILSSHKEFSGRMVYSPTGPGETMHFHGLSYASILAGKTCGVAPGSKLYYFAVYDDGKNFYNYTQALEQILKINETLASDKKIRIVSISDGIPETNEYKQMWNDELKKATDSGVIVLYSNNLGGDFAVGGCPPYKDRNDYKKFFCWQYV